MGSDDRPSEGSLTASGAPRKTRHFDKPVRLNIHRSTGKEREKKEEDSGKFPIEVRWEGTEAGKQKSVDKSAMGEREREREATYRVKTGKTRGKGEDPETRTEMSMATYATCLRANKFLVRAPNRGGGIRRASRFRSVYAEGDGDRTGAAENEFRARRWRQEGEKGGRNPVCPLPDPFLSYTRVCQVVPYRVRHP